MIDQKETPTGYPSIDKPWTKYYSEDEKNVTIPEGSMFDYLYKRNSQYLNDIAIEYYGKKITYKEFFNQIELCCRNLSALNIKKGDIVTIQALPLPQVIVMMYALNRIGACGNMLYPDAKADEVTDSMMKTNSRLLVVMDKIFSMYENSLPDMFNATVILMGITEQMSFIPKLLVHKKAAYVQSNNKIHAIKWKDFMSGKGKDYLENHDSTEPAFMLRTGGTTGHPKEVVLDSRGFNSVAEATYYSQICRGWVRQQKSILLQPPFIAFGVGSGVHHALSFGIRLIVELDVSPAAVTKILSKHKPNYIIAGTVQIEQYMADRTKKGDDLSFIRLLAVGGEALNASSEEKIQQFFANRGCTVLPVKGYGLTETSASVIAERVNAHKIGSVGIPLALCNMKIVDQDTNEELPYGMSGEVCLSSLGIMHEYYQNKDATDDVIETVDGVRWLHTGDIGFISEDGLLTITGRIKRIVVCKEGVIYHKVFPLLLEEKLATVNGVREISVVGRPDVEKGNVLVAYVVIDDNLDFEQVRNEIKEYCSAYIESFETPVEYVRLTELPRTMIGKVDYRSLEAMAGKRP